MESGISEGRGRHFRKIGQLSTWLIVGNAGGLAFTFKAALDGTTCGVGLLRESAITFLVGLIAAFVGATVSYIGTIVTVFHAAKVQSLITEMVGSDHFIKVLEAEGIEVTEDNPLQVQFDTAGQALQKIKTPFATKVIIALGLAAALVSTAALGWGVSAPIRQGDAVFAACTAGKARPPAVTLTASPLAKTTPPVSAPKAH